MDSYRQPVSTNLKQMPQWKAGVNEMSVALSNARQSSNSYETWKKNVECNSKPNASILKKQVTFKSSVAPVIGTNTVPEFVQSKTKSNDEFMGTPLRNPARQFEQIYMANIPHRSLDLSLIDLANPIIKPQELDNSEQEPEIVDKQSEKVPTTYKEFLEWQQCRNDNTKSETNYGKKSVETEKIITDIFNYNSPKGMNANKLVRESRICNNKMLKNTIEKENCQWSNKNVGKVEANPKEIGKCLPLPQCDIFSTGRDKTHDTLYDSFRTKLSEEQYSVNVPLNKPHVFAPPNDRMWNYDKFNKCVPINNVPIPSNHTNPLPNKDVLSTNNLYGVPQQCDTRPRRLSDSASQTSIVCCRETNKETDVAKAEDITVKDLLKIIQQQNEQLLLLQKQIANLLDRKEGPKQIEESYQKPIPTQNKVLTNGEQGDFFNSPSSSPRKGPLSKFSIDLMTSFEVSIRPQQNIFQRKQRDLINNEPKIQEIVEKETTDPECDKICRKEMVDSSLRLEEPLNIRESTPSPEPSIKIDMKEYESSDDDEDEDMTSKIGATFYKEMMRQVNIIIQKAQKHTNSSRNTMKTDEWGDETLNRTKDAIKHMKKIAKNFSTIDEGSASDDASDCDKATSDQISFAMKQLLMKYLPDEQLARLTQTQQRQQKKNAQDKIVLTSRTPEFSFATVEFMKKYDLISSNGNMPQKPPKNTMPQKPPKNIMPQKPPKNTIPQKPNLYATAINSNMLKKLNGNNPKILDISVLKQQPKLL